jgi:hypothetical protein
MASYATGFEVELSIDCKKSKLVADFGTCFHSPIICNLICHNLERSSVHRRINVVGLLGLYSTWEFCCKLEEFLVHKRMDLMGVKISQSLDWQKTQNRCYATVVCFANQSMGVRDAARVYLGKTSLTGYFHCSFTPLEPGILSSMLEGLLKWMRLIVEAEGLGECECCLGWWYQRLDYVLGNVELSQKSAFERTMHELGVGLSA